MFKKQSLSIVCFAVFGCINNSFVFAGDLGNISSVPAHHPYIAVTGGGYFDLYQANYTQYTLGNLIQLASFNDSSNNGFGQIALGTDAEWGTLIFDHQLMVSKLSGTEFVPVGSDKYSFSQKIDFGYDFMPKINLIVPQLDAYGILGVHYGQFSYKKTTTDPVGVTFDNTKNQVGFGLGAGLRYQFLAQVSVGVKYQYLQYGVANVYGTNIINTTNEIENFTPSFNLIGLEVRYSFV